MEAASCFGVLFISTATRGGLSLGGVGRDVFREGLGFLRESNAERCLREEDKEV